MRSEYDIDAELERLTRLMADEAMVVRSMPFAYATGAVRALTWAAKHRRQKPSSMVRQFLDQQRARRRERV